MYQWLWGWVGTLSNVKRPQVAHSMKKDQYITVLFLQKLKMSTQICTGVSWACGSLEEEEETEGDEEPERPRPHPAPIPATLLCHPPSCSFPREQVQTPPLFPPPNSLSVGLFGQCPRRH